MNRMAKEASKATVTVVDSMRPSSPPKRNLADYLFGRRLAADKPDLVMRRWYHAILHNNRGTVLRTLLRLRGGPRVLVVNVPFYVMEDSA
jgi:hypothetical protein